MPVLPLATFELDASSANLGGSDNILPQGVTHGGLRQERAQEIRTVKLSMKK